MVEIGEVVLPTLDRAASGGGGVLNHDPLTPARVVQPGKSSGNLRSGGKKFLHFLTVDPQITETLIRHTPHQTIEPADGVVFTQTARIEIEPLDYLHQHTG